MTECIKVFGLLLLLTFTTGSALAAKTSSSQLTSMNHAEIYDSVSALEWKYRLILINTKKTHDIESIFTKYKDAIDERNIAWFVFDGKKLISNITRTTSTELSKEIKAILAHHQKDHLVLIGYDGETKSANNGLDITGIFEQIDSMPIRQNEMNNK